MTDPTAGGAPPSQSETSGVAPLFFGNFQDLGHKIHSQLKSYDDAIVKAVKDNLLLVREHQAKVVLAATVTGFVLLPGSRRFLYRNTFGRFKSEKDILTDAELSLKELKQSVDKLKKDSANTRMRTSFGDQDLKEGRTDMRSAGHLIRSLANSIQKLESNSADLIHRLRTLPGRQSLELRAEVATLSSTLKNQRHVLQRQIEKISEFGIRV